MFATVLAPAISCRAQPRLSTRLVTDGLSYPVFVTHAPGDYGRLFIIEQFVGTSGFIRIFDINSGVLLPLPFLEIPGVTTEGEQGLLGMAFHPQYQSNGYLYVNYTTSGPAEGGRSVVARYTVSADTNVADPASQRTIITFDQPHANHNGGWMDFGPDGYLYIATGDGGDGDDPGNHAQTLNNDLLGKMLRLDVEGDDFPGDDQRSYRIPPTNPFDGVSGDREIWSYGLRNPWRNSFDRLTGDLWMADVGQAVWEELNFEPAGVSGRNYGWRCMEGPWCRDLEWCDCPGPLGVRPIYSYNHKYGCSVTGGYVYRGAASSDLSGTYFFADFCTARIWSLRYDGALVGELTERTAELAPGNGMSIGLISSFGEDAAGELYIVDYEDGQIFQIVARNGCTADFNLDSFIDGIDYDLFMATFETGAGADFNLDGFVDGIDSDAFNSAFEAGNAVADVNRDGFVDGLDYDIFNKLFEAGILSADVNHDGFVDGIDSDLFVNDFESGC